MPIALKPESTDINHPDPPKTQKRWYQRAWRFCAGEDPVSRFASAGAYVLLVVLAGIVASPAGALLAVAGLAGFLAIRFGARRWPQAIGMACSTIALHVAVIVFSMLLTPLLTFNGSYELAGAFLIAPVVTVLATLVSKHQGVHKGWTVLLSHVPMWAGLFAIVWLPQYASALACLSALIGVGIVLARSRMATGNRTSKQSLKKKAARSGAVVVIGVLSAGLLALSAPADEAKAFDWSFGLGDKMLCGIVSPNPTPTPVGNGMENVLPSGNLAGLTPVNDEGGNLMNTEMREMQSGQSLDSYTLYEVSGLRGLNYINWVKDKEGENTACMFMPWVGVTIGNFINAFGLFGLQVVISLKEFSQVANPFEPFYTSFTPTVSLMANIAFSMFGIAWIVVLLVFAYRGITGKRSIQEAGRQVGGTMIVAIIAGFAYGGLSVASTWNAPNGNGFYTVVSWLDRAAGTVNAGISNEVLGQVQTGDEAMCIKPEGDSVVDSGQRYSSCLLAEAMAYEPWALATFGPAGRSAIEPLEGSVPVASSEANEEALGEASAATPLPCYNDYQDCNDLRTYLISQIGGPDITGRMQQCMSENGFDPEAAGADNQAAYVACEPYHAVANDLMARSALGENPTDAAMITSFRGQSSGSNHFTQAFVGLISTFTVGLGIAMFAAATIYFHARLFMLFLMGPITLTMAAFKGAEHATRWASNVAQTIVARLIYGIMTTIIIFAVANISAMDLNSGYRLLMLGIIVFIASRMVREADKMSQFAGADGSSDRSGFGSVLGGNLASKAIAGTGRMGAGAVRKTGSAALTGAKWGAIGAGVAAYSGARVGSRPVRGAMADASARRAGKQAAKQRQNGGVVGDSFAQREGDRALLRNEQATATSGGRLADPDTATQRLGRSPANPPTMNRSTGPDASRGDSQTSGYGSTSGAAATAAAAGAAGGAAAAGAAGGTSRVGGSSPANPRSTHPDTKQFPAATPGASRVGGPAPTGKQGAGLPQERRDAAGTHRKRDTARRAAGATRNAFTSDPNGHSRLGEQYRSELFHQWVEEDNSRRNSQNQDVLNRSERKQLRRRVQNATPEQVVESTRGLTQDEKFQRLSDMQREQSESTRISPRQSPRQAPGGIQPQSPYGGNARTRRRRR